MTEISAMYEALDNMDDYALMANVKPIGPHKVLTDAIAELEQLRQRVAVLEAQLEKNNPLLDEAADAIDKLTSERDALKQQRDELLEVVEMAYKVASEHDDRLPFDWAVYCEMLYQAIASVKEK